MAAIGPWVLDPSVNLMEQFLFLNFTTHYINNKTDILPDVAIDLYVHPYLLYSSFFLSLLFLFKFQQHESAPSSADSA